MQQRLQLNDTIAFITPSSALEAPQNLKHKDYKIKTFSPQLVKTDDERLNDLHNVFSDKEVKAVICARGGYGALRLLDKINYNIIYSNAKIFAGSSDITLLSVMFYKKCNLITFHSQMGESLLKKEIFQDFLDVVNGKKNEILPKNNIIKLNKGNAKGILWGGNLATIVSLFGSDDYIPNENIILFLEDINEPLYKIDRMLTQISRNHALYNKIKGVIFGEFTGCDEQELIPILKKFSKFPAFYGYNISHGKNNQTVPFGAKAELFESGIIKFCL